MRCPSPKTLAAAAVVTVALLFPAAVFVALLIPAAADASGAPPAGSAARSATEAAASGGPPAAEAGEVRFRDGAREVLARRLPGPADADGRRPVALRYPGQGREVPARVGAEAVIQVAPGEDPGRLLAGHGLRLVRPLMPAAGLYLVDAPGEDGLALAARLAEAVDPDGPLRLAAPDLALRARPLGGRTEPPDDPRYGGQWYLDRIDIEAAWALETGAPEVTVVVVDNGCDADHPDLAGKLDPGRDVVDADDDPTYHPTDPGHEHGTACAGLVGAVTDNGEGIAGTCPGCRLRCVRMLAPEGEYLPTSASVEAFTFSLDVDAAVVSNSWGYVDPVPVPSALAEAIGTVHDQGRGGLGALVLFAAGNDGREVGDSELLAVRGVLGVGATTTYDEATSYTNFGASVDLSAPAGTLTTDISGAAGADPGDYTSRFGGTSSACPVAAGVAGLLVSAAPDASAAELEAALVDTARPAPYAVPDEHGHDPTYGYGIVDPAAALRRVLGLSEPVDETDGGTPPDADGGPDGDGAGGDLPGGCACGTRDGGAGAAGLLLAALVLAGVRRRRHG